MLILGKFSRQIWVNQDMDSQQLHFKVSINLRKKNDIVKKGASKGSNLYILFAITAAGVVPCGGRKKSPRTSSIVQIIFLFRSFEISKDIQSVQNTHV